ncbi:MAG: hypothetical protein HDS83_06930 [Bacteroidales bacterium]|nr:hypothetical protein [Bacteroidales bacterium]
MLSAKYLVRNIAGFIDCIYWRGLLQLPSDFIRAMREASDGRTATDTDSCAFFVYKPINANEGMTAATIIFMCNSVSSKSVLTNVYGSENHGKSKTLNALYDLVKSLPSFKSISFFRLNDNDIKAFFEYKGKIVGIMTMGDPTCENEVDEFLNECTILKCDQIFTSSRTKGFIYNMVKNYAANNGFIYIETSPLFNPEQNISANIQNFLHRTFAYMLEKLI